MKKIVHYLLVLTGLLLGTRGFAQDLVYEQDHGLSYNKGTINTDVLIQLIQEKQEELNKFVLQRIVTKSWISTNNEDLKKCQLIKRWLRKTKSYAVSLDSGRLDNFTTKYLIYSSLNELTISADRSKFGKNTLELLKETALIYGMAVAIDQEYRITEIIAKTDKSKNNQPASESTVSFSDNLDAAKFNRVIDIVLDICITTPELRVYFPIFSELSSNQNPDREWYEQDSEYYPYRQDPVVAVEYDSIRKLVLNTLKLVGDFRSALKHPIGSEQFWEAAGSIYLDNFSDADIHFFDEIKRELDVLGGNMVVALDTIRKDVLNLIGGYGPLEDDFPSKISKLRYDLRVYQNSISANITELSDDGEKLVDSFEKAWKELNGKDKEFKELLDNLRKKIRPDGSLDPLEVKKWVDALNEQQKKLPVVMSSFLNKEFLVLDHYLEQLEKMANRFSIIRSTLQVFAASEKSSDLTGFKFNKTQLEEVKELLDKFISYLEKTGKYNVAAVYLRGITDNITYIDSTETKPATISLNFESVLFDLNTELVTPARLERQKYLEPFVTIGVNYCSFIGDNQLGTLIGETTPSLNSLSFASEKIGVKFKFINEQYKRSFGPGVVYRYWGKNRFWNRPQPQSFFDDWFMNIYTGGLMYNLVNLQTNKNFDFPFVGAGLGFRTFNGLTLTASVNAPYTKNTFRTSNLFFAVSLDIPIVEYISALRKK